MFVTRVAGLITDKVGGGRLMALGIAALSTVFVTYGSTEGPQQFVDGLHPAVWVGVAVVFFGALCALCIPRRPRPADEQARARTPGGGTPPGFLHLRPLSPPSPLSPR
ncbi:hypothetical protein ACFZDK_45120 [Streptomyces sp. NPDC007901]|uniref:hypothetical protein n=1 Tax=Streptomyces sp. NPDC007901 TaxID=3364785 RepID=UPI0036F03120